MPKKIAVQEDFLTLSKAYPTDWIDVLIKYLMKSIGITQYPTPWHHFLLDYLLQGGE